ncbi:MAG: hypothetical protein QOD41_1826, partial [Cryptosporangiaceae bacterium]|nr:hypothetical protein [Cryptosporangiaceae bacterium]
MRALLAELADLLLPGSCAGCEAPGRSPCARCSAALRGPVSPVPGFDLPGLGVPGLELAGWCWSGGVYEGALRGLLLAYKEHKQHQLADPLGVLLARVVVAGLGADPGPGPGPGSGLGRVAAPGPVCLVAVPSGAAVARARGGQHVHRVASVAARELRRAGLRPA